MRPPLRTIIATAQPIIPRLLPEGAIYNNDAEGAALLAGLMKEKADNNITIMNVATSSINDILLPYAFTRTINVTYWLSL